MRAFPLPLHGPSVSKWLLFITASLALVRIIVLFSESYSVVRSERLADDQLIELCSRGVAAESDKFRTLCLQARAERAAPLVFKALLRAIRTAFSDFAEQFNSPSRIAILLLFCLSGLALPIVKMVSNLAGHWLRPDAVFNGLHNAHHGDVRDACEVLVLNGGAPSWTDRLRILPSRANRRLTLGTLEELSGDDGVWDPIHFGSEEKKCV